MEIVAQQLRLDRSAGRRGLLVGAIGAVVLLVAAWTSLGDEQATSDFYRAYLTSFMFFLSLALGGLFFVLVTHLTRAGWSVALRRLAEVVGWTVLPLGVLALVILSGMHELYEWTHADVVARDALLQHKQAWLNTGFFIARFVFYFLVWGIAAVYLLRRSVAQDASGDPELTLRMERFAAPAMIFFAMTVTFAAFDFLMSLYPHWYSTIYGVYYFAGSMLGFLALLPVLLAGLNRRSGLGRMVATEHLHDVGKLMFAFVVFWAYIAFSQYLLIWYGNVPEETIWYKTRQSGPWLTLSLVLLLGHFFLPFLWLMSRHPKRRLLVLVSAALWLLAMHWFDIFYLVMPEARPTGSPFRLVDLACFVGLGALFGAALLWQLSRVNLVPIKDPRLDESLRFENA